MLVKRLLFRFVVGLVLCLSICMELCRTLFLLPDVLCSQCLWRLTRMLDKLLETCQLDRLFLDLHNFLVMHPSSVWRQRSNNLPLRSIRTIIHHVAEKVGPKVRHVACVCTVSFNFLNANSAFLDGIRSQWTSCRSPVLAPFLLVENRLVYEQARHVLSLA